MKICTIICEYNPLHNGHVRLLNFARRYADTICCVMSGDFVQRGMPAIADKYTRARHAVLAGADIVAELPAVFSLSSAENFATGGIKIANAVKSDFLAFGCESATAEQLSDCAAALKDPDVNVRIKKFIQEGNSYPKAVALGLPEYSEILSRPNNTLALEYAKALSATRSDIKMIVCDRPDNYNCDGLKGEYASATAIRNNFEDRQIQKYLPSFVDPKLFNRDAEQQFKRYCALFLSTNGMREDIEGVSEGLHNRFNKQRTSGDYDEIISNVKTKRYTQVKLQRLLACNALEITKEITKIAKSQTPYFTVLAVNSKREDILSHLAQCNLTAPKQLTDIRTKVAEIDARAHDLYRALTGAHTVAQMQKVQPLQ